MKIDSLIWMLVVVLLPLWLRPFIKFVFTPIKFRFTRFVSLRRQWRTGYSPNLPPIVVEQVERYVSALVSAGFDKRLTVHAATDDQIERSIVLLQHHGTNEIATVLAAQNLRMHTVALSIIDEYTDESSLVTYTSEVASYLTPEPGRRLVNARFVQDASTLLQFHHARRTLHRLDGKAMKILDADPQAYVERSITIEIERLKKLKFIRATSNATRARYTLEGAFTLVIRLLEPFRSRRAAAEDRAARAEWQRSGMADAPVPASDDTHALPPALVCVPAIALPDLRAGRFQVESGYDGLHIAMGGTTRRQELLSLWIPLAWVVFILVILMPSLITIWQYHAVTGRWTMAYRTFREMWPWLIMLVFSVGLNIVNFGYGFRRRGGPFRLIVNHDGLAYRDSGARPRSGVIDRRMIRGITINRTLGRAWRRQSAICIHRFRGEPIFLMRNKDVAALTAIRNQIAAEIGLDQLPTVEHAFPVVPRASAPLSESPGASVR